MFIRTVCLSFLCLFVLQGVAHGRVDSDEFWVLTHPEYPFIAVDEKRRLSGYAVEVVKGILRQADMEQDILTAPWARVEKEARDKANVVIFALARTANREDKYHWITPITANVLGVYSNRKPYAELQSLGDVEALGRIGVLNGDIRHQLLQEANFSRITAYENWADAVQAMLMGQISSVFFSDAGVAFFCRRNQWNCKDVKRVLFYQQTQSYLAVSKSGTKQAFVQKLKMAAKTFKASEAYQKMAQYWLEAHRQETKLPMHIDNGTLNLWEQ